MRVAGALAELFENWRRCVARGSSVRYTRWPKPGIFSLRASLRADDVFGALGLGVCPISSSIFITSALAPPCSGPLSAPMARDDGRVDVGERGRRDAGGERRGVELVIGVQNQRDVERADRQRRRPLARQHVQEVRRVTQRRVRIDRPAAGLQPSPRGDERADLAVSRTALR